MDERKGNSGRAGGRLWARVPECQAGDTSHVNRFWLTSPDGRLSLLGGRRLWLESELEQVWTCAALWPVSQTQYQSCLGLSSRLQGLSFLACPSSTHCALLHYFFIYPPPHFFIFFLSFLFFSFSISFFTFSFVLSLFFPFSLSCTFPFPLYCPLLVFFPLYFYYFFPFTFLSFLFLVYFLSLCYFLKMFTFSFLSFYISLSFLYICHCLFLSFPLSHSLSFSFSFTFLFFIFLTPFICSFLFHFHFLLLSFYISISCHFPSLLSVLSCPFLLFSSFPFLSL